MLYIDRSQKTPLYEQLYNALVEEILSGAMPAGHRLPATRKLSEELSVGRNTVDKAYQQLAAEGYIQAKVGSGFIVNRIPLDFRNRQQNCSFPKHSVRKEAGELTEPAQPEKVEQEARYDFAYGSMDNSVFPYSQWRKSVNNVLTRLELCSTLHYPCRTGEPELREAICRYLRRSRNVTCLPEQVVITCGQQHSMEIIANMFGDRKKVFAMEEPGYDGIRAIFANHEYELIPVPVESDGISIDALQEIDTLLLYVTPSHQFPTGGVLPIGKRRQMLQWAEHHDSYIIEDDYDSELRYYTNPIPAMQSLDLNQRIIYTGTFSKSLAPSMRLAYIVFPESLLERYYDYYHRYNSQVTPLHQLTLADFIESGNYERHINRLRTIYRKKQEVLLSAISEVFGDKIKVYGGGAGIHMMLDVDSPLSQEELISRAEQAGIRFYSTSVLYLDEQHCPKNQLLLGFPTVPTEAFHGILETLWDVWEMDACHASD